MTARMTLVSVLIAGAICSANAGQVRRKAESATNSTDQGIVMGSVPNLFSYPNFARFVGPTVCGGTMISRNRVLTTAQCIQDGGPSSVVIGATTYYNGFEVDVECVKSHPDFEIQENPFSAFNDIAVLYLAKSSNQVPFFQINRDPTYPFTNGQQMRTVGFGETGDGTLPEKLLELETDFRTVDKCKNVYPEGVIKETQHICTFIPNGGGCNGDQGGPVIDGSGKLVGLLSFAYGCGVNSYFDVVTNVATYFDWIEARKLDQSCDMTYFPTQSPVAAPADDCFLSGLIPFFRDQIAVATEQIAAVQENAGSSVSGLVKKFLRTNGGE